MTAAADSSSAAADAVSESEEAPGSVLEGEIVSEDAASDTSQPTAGQHSGKTARRGSKGSSPAPDPAPGSESEASEIGQPKTGDSREKGTRAKGGRDKASPAPEVDPEAAVEAVVEVVAELGSLKGEIGSLKGEREELKGELRERTADLQRVTAEYANYRKRVERDRSLASDQATATVLISLLPVLDDLDRAREHGDLVGPFGAVAEQLIAALGKYGLTAFGAKGDPFNPKRHEAVAHMTSTEVTEPTCVDILRRGYQVGDRLLRAAMVAVADPD